MTVIKVLSCRSSDCSIRGREDGAVRSENSRGSTKLRRHAKLLFLAVLLHGSWARAQAPFQLRDGDRVVFYGDSTTELRVYDSMTDPPVYPTFVETYAITRFPRLRLEFVNSAFGGDRVTGGRGGSVDVRLQRDVIAYRPTVMTIMLGMNDAWGLPYDPKLFNTFATGYEHILKVVKSALPGIRITVIQPSPYDEVTRLFSKAATTACSSATARL